MRFCKASDQPLVPPNPSRPISSTAAIPRSPRTGDSRRRNHRPCSFTRRKLRHRKAHQTANANLHGYLQASFVRDPRSKAGPVAFADCGRHSRPIAIPPPRIGWVEHKELFHPLRARRHNIPRLMLGHCGV
jgi:hypothetical protein